MLANCVSFIDRSLYKKYEASNIENDFPSPRPPNYAVIKGDNMTISTTNYPPEMYSTMRDPSCK